MAQTFKEKYGKHIARMRKARIRLIRALIRQRFNIDNKIASGEIPSFDHYLVKIGRGRTVSYHLTFRGMREIWIRLFPKRRGKRFQFQINQQRGDHG